MDLCPANHGQISQSVGQIIKNVENGMGRAKKREKRNKRTEEEEEEEEAHSHPHIGDVKCSKAEAHHQIIIYWIFFANNYRLQNI
ncbi:hypothetical protein T01_11460 [Trichinella spiralis]|uniref:Uncharacterized protein n=1 Tax=Trichinella spiralis TaxID=6334 RepID=A0A0V1B2T1_TRISP|nr:hypothetical protein T01_11460 [Trichinella spiralis]